MPLTSRFPGFKDDLLYGKRVNENTVRFDEICSIPLTNLIGKFLRDLVASGKTFSLELKLDKTPDAAAQINNLLKESRYAYKYSDRLSVRAQEDHVRSELLQVRQSITSRTHLGGHLPARPHQRLVVENYSKIPEYKRDEIENILGRSRARGSFKVVDGKTFSENGSVSPSPVRSRFDSSAIQVHEPGVKPSTFNVYRQVQPLIVGPAGSEPPSFAELRAHGGFRNFPQ